MKDDPCGNPLFFYDGSDRAVLFRSFTSIVHLEGIPQKYQEALDGPETIIVIEFADQQVHRDYMATIERVPNVVSLFTDLDEF
jgi:hypothetical protein